MLNKNVCGRDRFLRIFTGAALLAAAILAPHVWWGWLGIVPLATGLIGSCPFYRLVGIDTCSQG